MKRPLSTRGVEAAGLVALLVAGGPGAVVAGLGILGAALPSPRLRPLTWTFAHGGALLAAGLSGLVLGSATGLAVLVTWLLVHRAWTGRTPDDTRVALLLATLLLLLGAVGTDSILLAPAMVAYGALLPVALLRAELAGTAVPRRLPVAMAVVCGTLAGAFFVALPRLDGGYLGHREGGRRFPDDVSLGGEGLVNDQGSEVMRVRVTTKEGTPLPGPFHFRGRSLERFDGHTWTAGAEVDRAKGRQWDVEQQVQTTGPAELLFGVPDVVDVKGVSARLDPGSAWLARSPGRSLTYTVRSRNVPFGELRGADEPRWLQLPEDLDRRVYPLAWSIQPDEEDPERIARALTEWLGATYGYEEAPGDPVGDPLAWFLFDHKAGHCEYFATALTVMLRARGVPARLATGFYSEEVDGEWIVVREGNAHAWVEVPVAGGWATLDPTPASGLPQVDAASLQAQLDEWMARWYQDVVEYDMNAQFAAYGAIGKRFIFATGGSVPEGSMRAGLLGMILVGGALGFTLITGRILLNRLGGPSVRGPSDPVARLAADARRRLRRRGWTVPSELPLLEAAAWLRTRVGDEAAPLERFAELAYRARYGGVAVPLAELRACVSALSSIRRPTGRG